MVIVRIKGGLGNQLFQYAAGYALARRMNTELIIDTSFFPSQTLRGYRLNKLKIENVKVLDSAQTPMVALLNNRYINKAFRKMHRTITPCGKEFVYLLENKLGIEEELFSLSRKNIYLDGYYQSEQYFSEYRKEILCQFVQKYELETEYLKKECEVKNVNSIAVHVRRGDFLKAQNDSNPRHYLLGKKYYEKAIKYIRNGVKEPIFFWFSDDINWVKDNFGVQTDFRFISLKTKNSDIDEMMLMRNCKHIIAANSTFSWWSAWLNENKEAIKIVPEKAYGIPEMIPEDWIKISTE